MGIYMDEKKLASYIDHTILKPDVLTFDIKKLCEEAVEYSFATVCINPFHVGSAKKFLAGTGIKVCTVVGFPLGATTKEVKAYEASRAIENGAHEIDMVINISALKEGNYDYVEKDIKSVYEACKGKALLKVIIETCLLEYEQKIKACEISVASGADFVKTSTGFSKSGAIISDIKLMKKTVGDSIGVKASGGIRDLKQMIEMIEAGATRIGTSSSVSIIKELNNK